MSKKRTVQQGEHLSRISAEEGFADFHTLFDHPENAQLKDELHRDPHLLFPGDPVFIPDRKDRTETGATDETHRFTAAIKPLFLRCKVLDWQRDAVKSAPVTVRVDGEELPPLTTNGDGILEQRIGRLAKEAQVAVELPPPKVLGPGEPVARQARFHVLIGSLNPITKLSGQQARLNNLGYSAGYDVRDLDQLHFAAEEFLCDDSGQRVTRRPVIQPAPPQGEDDPAKNDLAGATGLQDKPLLDRLTKAHGF